MAYFESLKAGRIEESRLMSLEFNTSALMYLW
jgi:hypothetical protein